MSDRDITARRHGGDVFSEAAHEQAKVSKARDVEIIKAYFRSRGRRGATCYQVVEHTGIKHETASARMTDLKTKDFGPFLVQVIDVDGKHKRGPSSASRPSGAGVWMAAE